MNLNYFPGYLTTSILACQTTDIQQVDEQADEYFECVDVDLRIKPLLQLQCVLIKQEVVDDDCSPKEQQQLICDAIINHLTNSEALKQMTAASLSETGAGKLRNVHREDTVAEIGAENYASTLEVCCISSLSYFPTYYALLTSRTYNF